MLHTRTHILIDNKLHHIVEVVEQDGVLHTHRVHTGCGLTVDVDHEGAKHKAVSIEHRTMAAEAHRNKNPGLHFEHMKFAEAAEERAKQHEEDVAKSNGRWRTHDQPMADCETCAGVEAGDARPVSEQGFNPPANPGGAG